MEWSLIVLETLQLVHSFLMFRFQLAKNVGNSNFNEIVEGNLPCPSPKPTPSSDM